MEGKKRAEWKERRGRPRNADRKKNVNDQRIEEFLTVRESQKEFKSSLLIQRTPNNKDNKESKEEKQERQKIVLEPERIGIDKINLVKWKEEIKEMVQASRKDLIEEMIKGMENLRGELKKIEEEMTKKEKRWERERAELLDRLETVSNRLKRTEEKLEKRKDEEGIKPDTLEKIAIKVQEKMQGQGMRQMEAKTEKDFERVLKYVEDRKKRKEK